MLRRQIRQRHLTVPEAAALSRQETISRVTDGQAITGETAVKALATLLALHLGALGTVQATAASSDAGVARGVTTPPTPVALTQAWTFTDRFNPSSRFTLELTEHARQSVADFLTKLVGIDGVRIVAEKRDWNRPEILLARRYFWADSAFRPYASFGINRGRYVDPSTTCLGFTASSQTRRSFGVMAEVGSVWRITPRLEMNADVHWFASNKVGQIMRTDAGWASADPIVLSLSVVWRYR